MTDYTLVPIAELIPHTAPMVLLHRIIEYSDSKLTAEIDIHPHSMFFDDRLAGVPTWAGIEYMAQAIAALGGIHTCKEKKAVNVGFLLGTRKYTGNHEAFLPGKTYQICVNRIVRDASGLACFACTITLSGEPVCEARINVFETSDAQAFLDAERGAPTTPGPRA